MNVIDMDWATEKATRIIKGYRVVGGRGKDLRDDIARALRKIEQEARIKQRVEDDANEVEPVQEAEAPIDKQMPLSQRLKTTQIRYASGYIQFEAMGFVDIEEAKTWADRWCANNMGYTPLASATTTSDGSIIVFCKKWNSCD